ncbi:MAG: response regulator [Anaerolineae bacterium]|nr:response regulator [Anaerolineales bacterium]MCQ3977695.1 two-component system response regulator [Anaerolineae bacterium]
MSQKVLIVDDETNIVISLEFLIAQAGYDLRVAHNGQEAMEQVAAFEPDLILLDVMLPHINGFEVCRRVRENPAWQRIKIIMLTAKGREVEVTKGLALGADAYVTKPFSTKELLAQVRDILGDNESLTA